MEMDRELQYKILSYLMDESPRTLDRKDLFFLEKIAGSESALAANLLYFEDHGLIKPGSVTISGGGAFLFNSANLRISAKGVDFLAADGGLGAILNAVTVKIHDESLARIADFLARAELNPHIKHGYLARLRELPADAIKHLCLKILDLGLENSEKVLPLLQKTLGLAQ